MNEYEVDEIQLIDEEDEEEEEDEQETKINARIIKNYVILFT